MDRKKFLRNLAGAAGALAVAPLVRHLPVPTKHTMRMEWVGGIDPIEASIRQSFILYNTSFKVGDIIKTADGRCWWINQERKDGGLYAKDMKSDEKVLAVRVGKDEKEKENLMILWTYPTPEVKAYF